TIKIPVKSTTAANGAAFHAAFDAQPKPLASDSKVQVEGNAINVSVAGLPAALRGKTLEFFPETGEVIETAGKWTQAWQGDTWTARVPLSAQRAASPAVMPVVVALGNQGWRTEAKVIGQWPAAAGGAAAASLSPSLQAALRGGAGNSAPGAPVAPATASITLVV